MKKSLLCVVYIFSFTIFFIGGVIAQAPDWTWAISHGASLSVYGNFVAVDDSGYSYLTGRFSNDLYLDNDTLFSFGGTDILIAKYDKAGSLIWIRHAGGSYGDQGLGIALDNQGNFFITGFFQYNALFGNITIMSNTSTHENIFVAKYDTSGNAIWVRTGIGSRNNDEIGRSISADEFGNCYVSGEFYDTTYFGTDSLISAGACDIFLAKYDALGNLVWLRRDGSTAAETISGVVVKENGCYLAGDFFVSTVIGNDTMATCGGNFNIFIAKYDTSGNEIWARCGGGIEQDHSFGISSDKNENIFITGGINNTAVFSNDTLACLGFDVLIAKYDSAGNIVWAKRAGGISIDQGNGIVTDLNGNSYVTGWFSDNAAFDTLNIIGNGNYDLFVAKYDPSGNVVWVQTALDNGNLGVISKSIAVNTDSSCIVTGYFFADTVHFGDHVVSETSLTNMFLAKLGGIFTGIDNYTTSENEITIYPNPAQNYLLIKAPVIGSILIYNIVGEIILNTSFLKPDLSTPINLDISKLKSGIYFVQIRTGDFYETKKLLIEQ